MEQRDSGLQTLFDRAETAVLASQNRDGEAHRAARLVFARLRESVGRPSAAEPAQLPVCAHLPAALAACPPSRKAVAGALGALLPRLSWGRRKTADPSDTAFWHGHANTLLAGPGGLEERDDLMVGATVIAPGVLYPDHTHPPEEVYLSLTAGEWWNARMDWTDPGPEGLIYNPPGILHAMRAAPGQPFLALWFLPF